MRKIKEVLRLRFELGLGQRAIARACSISQSTVLPESVNLYGMIPNLMEVVGFRGEKVVELCLTNYESFAAPLFRPGFLGDKWPSIDFYVERRTVRGGRPTLGHGVRNSCRSPVSDAPGTRNYPCV